MGAAGATWDQPGEGNWIAADAAFYVVGSARPARVRDVIAYTRAPEQVAPILAVYVNDMGAAGATWDQPGKGNWIAAEAAFLSLIHI